MMLCRFILSVLYRACCVKPACFAEKICSWPNEKGTPLCHSHILDHMSFSRSRKLTAEMPGKGMRLLLSTSVECRLTIPAGGRILLLNIDRSKEGRCQCLHMIMLRFSISSFRVAHLCMGPFPNVESHVLEKPENPGSSRLHEGTILGSELFGKQPTTRWWCFLAAFEAASFVGLTSAEVIADPSHEREGDTCHLIHLQRRSEHYMVDGHS